MKRWWSACRKIRRRTIKEGRCIMTSYPLLSNPFAEVIRMPLSIGWLVWLPVAKIRNLYLVISASEDIGLANPNALLLANACFDALKKIGWPEGRIILAETTVYLACSPKSNSAYMAINDALELVNRTGNLPVPLHLRNAPTKLMAELNYGKDYKYAHDYENHFVKQEFLPKEILNERLWKGQENPSEHKLIEQMRRLWGDRYQN